MNILVNNIDNRWGSIYPACFKCSDDKLSMTRDLPLNKSEIVHITSVTETNKSLFKSRHIFINMHDTITREITLLEYIFIMIAPHI